MAKELVVYNGQVFDAWLIVDWYTHFYRRKQYTWPEIMPGLCLN